MTAPSPPNSLRSSTVSSETHLAHEDTVTRENIASVCQASRAGAGSSSTGLSGTGLSGTGRSLERARSVQPGWARTSLSERMQAMGRLASAIAVEADTLVTDRTRTGEQLASEVFPLAEACRFMARRAKQVLAPRRLSRRDAAWWMGSISVLERREAYGLVLIIGPGNYPLLLPGVQMVQALTAGNAAIVKPAPGGELAIARLAELCAAVGIPADLIQLLPVSVQAAQEAMNEGVDKVVFTGGYRTGQSVAERLTTRLTPSAMELSGTDPVFVLDDADLDRVAASVVYALALNAGQSCIAPRRLCAPPQTLEQLIPLIGQRVERLSSARPASLEFARSVLAEAVQSGARVVCGSLADWQTRDEVRPIVLADVEPSMRVAREDIFAPVLSLIAADTPREALSQAASCRFALGASIFGAPSSAMAFADSVVAGCITLNDVLVPTADPRVSFGGWNASGFGVTRGLEGLREMSRLQVVCRRRGRWLPHLTSQTDSLPDLMRGLMLMRHGQGFSHKWRGLKILFQQLRNGRKKDDRSN